MAKCSVCGKEVGMRYVLFEGEEYCYDCYRTTVPQGGMMQNQSEKVPGIALVFAVFAWMEWIFGAIGAYILSNEFGEMALIVGLIVVFAAGCIPMGFSTIIRLLAEIAWNTKPEE